MARDADQAQPLLSVLIVNYRSWPDVERLADALLADDQTRLGRCEVVIVDNDSGEPAPAGLASGRAGLTLILHDQNRGFAAGVNAGWRAARGRWLLLLNPDVVVPAGFPGAVLRRIGQYERREGGPPGIVGLRLLNADGTIQPSVGFEPSLLRSLRGVFLPRSRRKYQPESRHRRPGPAPWVTGACALVHRPLMDTLGGMDEEFFLYYEEVALCRSATRLGRGVEHDPSLAVTHLRPLQNRAVTASLRVITRASLLLYFRKHLPRWQFLALTAVVGLESRVRTAAAQARGRQVEANAWRCIGGIARDARRGRWLSAADLRDLAARFAEDRPRGPRPRFSHRKAPSLGKPAG